MRSFIAELRRRNVLRAGALYIAAAWALAQGIAQLSPVVGAPDWVTRGFLVAASIGFPFWIAFAWFYEFTPDGFKRESELDRANSITARTGRKLDRWIIAIMGLAIVLLLTDRLLLRPGAKEETAIPLSPHSIAVLPFINMSSEKDQDYFSDGISESVLNLLTRVQQLQVTARTSSFSFKGKEVSIPELAQRLHVAHVLVGSVQKAGNEVRITVQLMDVETDTQRWSQTYDRALGDIFKIQDDIAADVVKELQVSLLGDAPKSRPTDPRAYELYLRGVELGRQVSAGDMTRSNDLLHQALAIDANFAPAWVELGRNDVNSAAHGMVAPNVGYTSALEATSKALAIEPDLASAYAVRAFVKLVMDDDAGAAKDIERAMALDPNNLDSLNLASFLLQILGRLDESLVVQEAAVARDPVNVTALLNLGSVLRFSGRYDEAIAAYRTVSHLDPTRAFTHAGTAIALLLKGNPQAALKEVELETGDLSARASVLAMSYHALGRKSESDAALADLIAKFEKESPVNIAYVYAFRGEPEQTFYWLNKGIAYQDAGLTEITTENFFANVHSDSRWLPFLRGIGKAPEQLAKIDFEITLPKLAPAR